MINMLNNVIRCNKCGVILLDRRKKKIRSCAHYPLIIEKFDGNEPTVSICLGSERNGHSQIITVEEHDFNKCFELALKWQ